MPTVEGSMAAVCKVGIDVIHSTAAGITPRDGEEEQWAPRGHRDVNGTWGAKRTQLRTAVADA